MINIYPYQKEKNKCFLPFEPQLEYWWTGNNIAYILRDTESTDINDFQIVKKDSNLHSDIQLYNYIYPFSQIIRIDKKKFDCSACIMRPTISNNNDNFWMYVGCFSVKDELWIGDVLYINSLPNSIYKRKCKDEFFCIFCNLSDVSEGNYVTDVVIINERMYNDYEENNIDITLFDDNTKPIYNIDVESEYLAICKSFDISKYDEWYITNIKNYMQIGLMKHYDGIVVRNNSDYDSYPLYKYEDIEKNHLCYRIKIMQELKEQD